MKYIEFNTSGGSRRSDEASHYILVLDSSGSMNGSPWTELMASVKEFLKIRTSEGPGDLISCIVFNDSAQTVFEGQQTSETLTYYMKYKGGGTQFDLALREVIRLMNRRERNEKFNIIFMSDGDGGNPTIEIQELQTQYMSRIAGFWTVGYGSGVQVLENMVIPFGGKYLNPKDMLELKDAFAEIARS